MPEVSFTPLGRSGKPISSSMSTIPSKLIKKINDRLLTFELENLFNDNSLSAWEIFKKIAQF